MAFCNASATVVGITAPIYRGMAPHHLRWVEKNLSGIGRDRLLGVTRPRLRGEATCWKPFVSIPIKVFRADAGPPPHILLPSESLPRSIGD